MKNAWRTLAAVGLVTSFAIMGGCVVGDGDDENTGGTGGTGGTTGGTGGTTGGTGGTTGGTGGASGSGGATGGSAGYECEPATGGVPGTPGSCEPSDTTDACQTCIKAKCCTEFQVCVATAPGNPCWEGGPKDGDGEMPCFQTCYTAELDKGTDPSTAKGTCAGQCATPSCGTVAGATSDLIACLDTGCLTECFTKK